MSTINLSKRVETVSINLKKQNIETITANIGLCLDISGSFEHAYRSNPRGANNSIVQGIVDRFFAMAFRMDPDKVLDVWLFNTSHNKIEQMEESDYGTYVEKKLLRHGIGGGTNYAPVLTEVHQFYFPTATAPVARPVVTPVEPVKKTGLFGNLFGGFKKDEVAVVSTPTPVVVEADEANNPGDGPVLVLFITDGANDDQESTRRIFERAKNSGVYIQCLGVGPRDYFSFLESMAKQYGNVGFTNVTDIGAMSDEDLYDKVINSEFAKWANPFIK